MMAISRASAINNLLTLLLTGIASAKPAAAWVAPHSQRAKTIRTLGQNAKCFSSAREGGEVIREGTATNENNVAINESWDQQVIRWVDGILEQKSVQSPLAIESLASIDQNEDEDVAQVGVPYEWIVDPSDKSATTEKDSSSRPIALRTTGTPLLDPASIAMIRGAAQNLWDRQTNSTNNETTTTTAPSSRFTLQFEETNSECHLDELVASDSSMKLRHVVDDLLTNKVYPLVRSAFGNSDNIHNNHRQYLTDGSLCVYDSLVVRYNGDKTSDRFGASQPLHGDGGVVSVNIALNSHRDKTEHAPTRDSFAGGGTFFEDLIPIGSESNDDAFDPILRPISTGHALAHWSTHRHAGAPTRSGIRDVLVIFLTQRRANPSSSSSSSHSQAAAGHFHGIERSFQLRLKARELPVQTALQCLDVAISESPWDAQAHFWKGFHLIQQQSDDNERRWQALCRSIDHLERAMECAPRDAKISCYAGMAYRQRWMAAQKRQQSAPSKTTTEDLFSAAICLERALWLHEKYRRHGISSDFEDNATTARLTLGEVYIQLERFGDAIRCLSSIDKPNSEEAEASVSEAMQQHISKLIAHCHEQQEAMPELSVAGAN